ncbi:unnamed protein product [Caenorhabditis nigoni]
MMTDNVRYGESSSDFMNGNMMSSSSIMSSSMMGSNVLGGDMLGSDMMGSGMLNNTNNNNQKELNNMEESMETQGGGSGELKRKSDAIYIEIPIKKHRFEEEYALFPIAEGPSADTMGIYEPMEPNYDRLPEGFDLGKLAREKFAGIVKADLYDQHEIQIYCRIFEHFSYYPYYKYDQDVWVNAHDHAFDQVLEYRTPPALQPKKSR